MRGPPHPGLSSRSDGSTQMGRGGCPADAVLRASSTVAGLDVKLLGPLWIGVGGTEIVLSGPRQRAVVAALAIRANQVVSTDTIIDDVWGDDPTGRAGHSLQQQVSSLRKLFAGAGSAMPRRRSPPAIRATSSPSTPSMPTTSNGSPREAIDAASDGRHAAAIDDFDAALAAWRGPVLADVPESPALLATAARLDERRLAAHEERVDSMLALGRHRDAVPALDALVADHPFRERLRAAADAGAVPQRSPDRRARCLPVTRAAR